MAAVMPASNYSAAGNTTADPEKWQSKKESLLWINGDGSISILLANQTGTNHYHPELRLNIYQRTLELILEQDTGSVPLCLVAHLMYGGCDSIGHNFCT